MQTQRRIWNKVQINSISETFHFVLKKKPMLSSLHNYFFQFFEQIGRVLIMQMQEPTSIHDNDYKWTVFEIQDVFVIEVKEKPISF